MAVDYAGRVVCSAEALLKRTGDLPLSVQVSFLLLGRKVFKPLCILLVYYEHIFICSHTYIKPGLLFAIVPLMLLAPLTTLRGNALIRSVQHTIPPPVTWYIAFVW